MRLAVPLMVVCSVALLACAGNPELDTPLTDDTEVGVVVSALVGPCTPLTCSGHGVCTDNPDLTATCACDEGYTTDNCSVRSADYGRRVLVSTFLADPDVIQMDNGHFVVSGTRDPTFELPFYDSTDLTNWTQIGAYNPSVADPNYDYCWVWAPDISEVDGVLTLFFSAIRGNNGTTTCPSTGSDVATYRATSPDGSLNFGAPEPLFPGTTGARTYPQSGCPPQGCDRAIRIDSTVYDGRLYYTYFQSGNNIASIPLNDNTSIIRHAGPANYALQSYEEGINEGPELMERNGTYYMFFSAAWYNSQYATFYVMGSTPTALNRGLTVRRLTTPVRRKNGTLIETHGHNAVVMFNGEPFNFFHKGVFNSTGGLIRRDTYRQRLTYKADNTMHSQNQVAVTWNSLGTAYKYSLDLVLRSGAVIGPCASVSSIGTNEFYTYTGVCPDAANQLFHRNEVAAFRLYSQKKNGYPWKYAGQTSYDGYTDTLSIAAVP